VDTIEHWPLKIAAVNRHLFDELGYGGDHGEYYDPRNSYLNQVFERRLGNPISLALVPWPNHQWSKSCQGACIGQPWW